MYCSNTFESIIARNEKYCSRRCGFNAKVKHVDIEQIKQRYLSGEDSPVIAKSLGVSATFIVKRLKAAGIEMRPNWVHILTNNPTKGKGHTPETKEKIRVARMHQLPTPESQHAFAVRAGQASAKSPNGKAYNKIEQILARLLDGAGETYQQQYELGPFVYDFYIPARHLLIEVHGTYWHTDPRRYPNGPIYDVQRKNRVNDHKKARYAEVARYNFLVLWEIDLQTTPTECVNAVCQIHRAAP